MSSGNRIDHLVEGGHLEVVRAPSDDVLTREPFGIADDARIIVARVGDLRCAHGARRDVDAHLPQRQLHGTGTKVLARTRARAVSASSFVLASPSASAAVSFAISVASAARSAGPTAFPVFTPPSTSASARFVCRIPEGHAGDRERDQREHHRRQQTLGLRRHAPDNKRRRRDGDHFAATSSLRSLGDVDVSASDGPRTPARRQVDDAVVGRDPGGLLGQLVESSATSVGAPNGALSIALRET